MKFKFTLSIIFLLSFGFSFSLAEIKPKENVLQKLENLKNPTFEEIRTIYEEHWKSFDGLDDPNKKKPAGWKQYKRWEHFWESRLMPDGRFPNGNEVLKEWEKYLSTKKSPEERVQSQQWKLLGPENEPGQYNDARKQGLGRVNVVRFDPENPSIIWAGTATGGVWRSTDYGKSWSGFPFTNFLSQGVSDIAVYPKSPGVIYVATGDDNGTYGTAANFYSVGLLKSYYGGLLWETTNLSKSLSDRFVISRVLVHPDNFNIVIVGTSSGVMKTTDGGKTWESKFSGSYVKDMEFMVDNPNVINGTTFSNSGQASFIRSTDNGNTWQNVQTVSGASRIAITVSPSNPNKVWAIAARAGYSSFHSFHISNDRGQTWEKIIDYTVSPNILGRQNGNNDDSLEGQGNYDLCIAVHPTNENNIYIGGINLWQSDDGGITFKRMTSWVDSQTYPFLHADQHDLMFKPGTTNLFVSNDGGLHFTSDLGKSWNDITNGMSITQYYRIGQSKTNENLIIGGCQDNGTNMRNDTGWVHLRAGDGMECAIHPTDNKKMFMTYYYGSLHYSTNSGNTFRESLVASNVGEKAGWITPFVIDEKNPNIMYIGFQNIYKSSEGGRQGTWKKMSNFSGQVFQSMAIAASNSNIIYAATYYNLYISTDGGQTWGEKYNSARSITYIAVDPNNEKRIWITFGDFYDGYKVFEINDTLVKNISGNLPNVPVNCIVYQNNSPDRLYIGTDIGVFFSDYNSGYWEFYGSGIPNLIINELEIFYPTKKIRAATYGRGIWEAPILDCNMAQPNVTVVENISDLCQGDTVTLEAEKGFSRYEWSNGDTTRVIKVTASGTYSVRVFGEDGCFANSRGVNISFKPVPELKIFGYVTSPGFCKNDSVKVSASLGFVEYIWSTGQKGRSIYITKPGEYWVKGKANNGCERITEKIFFNEFDYPPAPVIEQNGNLLSANAGETEVSGYKWYLNDTLIQGATQKDYLISVDGLYKVEITDKNGCKSISDEFNAVVNVDENQIYNNIRIYPNPTENEFNILIRNEDCNEAVITVSNILGNEIAKMNANLSNITDNVLKINLSDKPSGIYFIELKICNERFYSKINKSR
jgi:photosystem II stability/assembly factor-like uncharacterized protein